MITHGNIVATCAGVITVVPRLDSKDVYLAYLPLAHVFELAAEVPSYLCLILLLLFFWDEIFMFYLYTFIVQLFIMLLWRF